MGKSLLKIFGLCLILATTACAQDSLSYLLRVEGHAVAAETLERLVDFKASPQWSKVFRHPQSRKEREALAELLLAFALAGDTGRGGRVTDFHTGRRLAILDEWRGKLKLRLKLPYSPTGRSKKYTVLGIKRLAGAIRESTDQEKIFRLTAVFDPAADQVEKSALQEYGSQVFVTLPADRDWSASRLESIIRSALHRS